MTPAEIQSFVDLRTLPEFAVLLDVIAERLDRLGFESEGETMRLTAMDIRAEEEKETP